MIKRARWPVVAGVLLVVLAYPVVAAVYAAFAIPRVADLQGDVDVIVVLGGETTARVAEGAALFAAGRATRVLVSGAGDCATNRDRLIVAGIPPAAILLDCTSSSTWENSQRAAVVLRALHARRAIVVTSWFHIARALTCFAQNSPLRFYAAAAGETGEKFWTPEVARFIGMEYLKSGWYAVRYGANPFTIDWSGSPEPGGA